MISLNLLSTIPSKKILTRWVNWLNNKKVSKYSNRSKKKHTFKTQINFLKEKISNRSVKIFLIYSNQNPIGVLELCNIDLINKNCEIRYLIGELNLWGKGLASESIKLASKYAFKILKIKTIYADTHQDNLASQKVLKKNSFKIQGVIRKFFNNRTKARDKIIFVKNKK